jgi:signal transduction histidine kinase/phage shock protein PspC (stress-responsive transcriptional regulator)
VVTTQKKTRDKRSRRAGWVQQRAERPLHKLRFARSRDAVIGGVAGGLGERFGVDPVIVRIAFVLLTFAGAIGVIAYIAAWSVALDPGDRRAPKARDPDPQQAIAFSAMVLGSVFLLHAVGLWLAEALFVPVIVGAVGAGVVLAGTGVRTTRARGRDITTSRPSFVSLLIGGAFVVGGVTWFLFKNRSFGGIYAVVVAIAMTTFGLAIVFGPWVFRVTNQLGDERRNRIRSEERSELAAHLHDSVLQTLALIQRNASSPRKMASLARRQERELRAWLYGQMEMIDGPRELEAAVHEMADAIEEAHEVSIETVVVGECIPDDRGMAVVQACREAANNAALHSGVEEISVYIECEPHLVTAYVRDRGKGFDPEHLPPGRRGITDSIRGRIERHGGSVVITSAPDEGCEVQITMPIERNR